MCRNKSGNHGKNSSRGDKNNQENQKAHILPDNRNSPEIISPQHYDKCPGDPSQDIIEQEPAVIHGSDTGKKRCERPYDRNETRNKDSCTAIFFIESVGAVD